MKKKKSIFTKIASFFMIFCMAFLMTGCFGSSPNSYDPDYDPSQQQEGDDQGFGSSIGLFGTKVLYRPDHYDYNKNTGGDDETENNYYAQYAWQIINALYEIYGIPLVETNSSLHKYNANMFTSTNLPYLFDSIRYKVDTFGEVKQQQTYNTTTNQYNDPVDLNSNSYVILGADYNTSWNWSFKADLDDSSKMDAFIYTDSIEQDYMTPIKAFQINGQNGHIFNKYYDDISIDAYYNLQDSGFRFTEYPKIYRDTSTKAEDDRKADYASYSQFTKALEYVIYSYALDLEPSEIVVTKTGLPSQNFPYYAVTVAGYASDNDRTSVEKALEERIALFEKIGSFVGLVNRQITKITNWILNNVIGANALANDNFTTYDSVTEIVDQNNNVTYNLGHGTTTSLGRDYTNTVTKLVQGVCRDVTIGSDEDSGEGIHVDERFLASQIKEYAGDTFLIQDDENFALVPENANLPYIQPLEYQSVTLMFKEDTYVADLWIALKYDAGLDGTDAETFTNNYLDIVVDINYYNHENNTLQTISSQVTRVFDGPYYIDFMGEYNHQDYEGTTLPEGHRSGVMFDAIGQNFNSASPHPDAVLVKGFNPNVGNGILKTDVGRTDYNGSVLVSQAPLTIDGFTNLRKYYSLIESQSTDPGIDQNHSYITGKLNSAMFAGNDGCDYLEITYKVIKKNGDGATNYKFYTGLQMVNAMSVREADAQFN